MNNTTIDVVIFRNFTPFSGGADESPGIAKKWGDSGEKKESVCKSLIQIDTTRTPFTIPRRCHTMLKLV